MEKRAGPGRPRVSPKNRKELISKSASRLFSDLGYERTTIRLIAESAGVDPKLVMHYFGNKQKLFIATVKLPTEFGAGLAVLSLTPKTRWGQALAEVIWLAQKSGSFQNIVGVIRASSSEPEAAKMFKEFYFENLLMPIVSRLKVDNQELRAVMLTSLMVGYVFNLEISGVFESVQVSTKARKKLFGSIVQTILTSKI